MSILFVKTNKQLSTVDLESFDVGNLDYYFTNFKKIIMTNIKTERRKRKNEYDEDALFERSVLKMRQEIAKGRTFAQACEILKDIEEKLRPIIQDDFLKIIIAEQHFGQGRGIDDVALFLDLPYETVEASREKIISEFDEVISGNITSSTSRLTH